MSKDVISISEYKGTALNALTLQSTVTYQNGKPNLEKQYDQTGALNSQIEYLYTDAGLLSEITGKNKDNAETWKYTYTYDEQGRFIKEVSFGAEEKEEWEKDVTYDETESPQEIETTYNADGSVTMKQVSIYDAKKRLIDQKRLYPDDQLLKRTVYTYSENNHITQESHYDKTGLYENVNYAYNDAGLIKKKTTEGIDKTVKAYTNCTYDKNNKLIIEEQYKGDGTLQSKTEYAYDFYGSRIYEKTSDGQYILREIKYAN